MDLRSLQLYRSEVRTSNHERLDLRGPRVSGLERRRRAAEQRNTRRRREAAEQSLAARTQAVARKKRIRTSRAKALNRIKDCGDSGNATPQALQLAKRPRSKRRSIKPLLVLSGIFASKLTKRSDSERRQALQGKHSSVKHSLTFPCLCMVRLMPLPRCRETGTRVPHASVRLRGPKKNQWLQFRDSVPSSRRLEPS